MSEDAAARRSSAARLVKQFPLLLEAVARGELHLTGLLMLGPHLTPENHVEVLARAKHRTKKEIAKLVRELHPLPRVPDVIEPVGPEPRRRARRPTWAQLVASREPPVRELPPGQRPADWANDGEDEEGGGSDAESESEPIDQENENPGVRSRSESPPLPPITAPQQYQMQFSTTEEHVQLVERAKALMARAKPGLILGELHLEAMKLLVASLEKEKFAVNARSRKHDESLSQAEETLEVEPPRRRVKRRRYVPAAVRRAVFERDCGQCSYVDERGVRCTETHYLELHHLEPFAKGGEHCLTNLSLRCAAHNALAAEQDFGRDTIQRKRDASRHESFKAQLVDALTPEPDD